MGVEITGYPGLRFTGMVLLEKISLDFDVGVLV